MGLSKRKIKILAIVGQTATGKSSLAIQLAQALNGEIVSADSRQIYQGMDKGTGKVTKHEQKKVRHHLIDIVSPLNDYSVAHYVRDAKKAINEIARNGKIPIVCGGTSFWIDSLIFGLPIAPVPPNVSLRKKLSALSLNQLIARLRLLNPDRIKTIDTKNPVRLIRAIEIETFGTLPALPTKKIPQYDVIWVGLRPSRKKLYQNIHVRLFERLRKGMVSEVRQLHASGVPWKRLERFGLEYRNVALFLQGHTTKEEMATELEKDIRKYAKRQMTWLKKNKKIRWFASSSRAFSYAKKTILS